jgi:hypothetical protein
MVFPFFYIGPGSPTAETEDLKSSKYEFESHPGHLANFTPSVMRENQPVSGWRMGKVPTPPSHLIFANSTWYIMRTTKGEINGQSI